MVPDRKSPGALKHALLSIALSSNFGEKREWCEVRETMEDETLITLIENFVEELIVRRLEMVSLLPATILQVRIYLIRKIYLSAFKVKL